MENRYETIAELDGLKYEIVDTGQVIQACTFGVEMMPRMVRRTLGTFTTKAEARARLQQEIDSRSSLPTKETKP